MSEEMNTLLPHRDPFLFVDTIESFTEETIVGYRTFPESEWFFKGHFPGYPVVPGVLLVESMAQCGGAGVNKLGTLGDSLFFLATIDKVKLRRQVRPGDRVRMVITNDRVSGRMLKQSGIAYVGDEVACEASWMCLVGKNDS